MSHGGEMYNVGNIVNIIVVSLYVDDGKLDLQWWCFWNVQKYWITVYCALEINKML